MAGISVVEAVIMFLVSIVVLYVMEITYGAVIDAMVVAFANVYVEGMRPEWVTPILDKFSLIHHSITLIVVAVALWVVRVVIFQHGYTRGYP